MKKSHLKNIIKEEIKSTLKEADWDDLPGTKNTATLDKIFSYVTNEF